MPLLKNITNNKVHPTTGTTPVTPLKVTTVRNVFGSMMARVHAFVPQSVLDFMFRMTTDNYVLRVVVEKPGELFARYYEARFHRSVDGDLIKRAAMTAVCLAAAVLEHGIPRTELVELIESMSCLTEESEQRLRDTLPGLRPLVVDAMGTQILWTVLAEWRAALRLVIDICVERAETAKVAAFMADVFLCITSTDNEQ